MKDKDATNLHCDNALDRTDPPLRGGYMVFKDDVSRFIKVTLSPTPEV